jgi:hypothetical protein
VVKAPPDPNEINPLGIVMNRTAARATAVVLAVAVTFGGLKGISLPAAVASSARAPVVVLPRVEVTATALQAAPVDVAATKAEGNRF